MPDAEVAEEQQTAPAYTPLGWAAFPVPAQLGAQAVALGHSMDSVDGECVISVANPLHCATAVPDGGDGGTGVLQLSLHEMRGMQMYVSMQTWLHCSQAFTFQHHSSIGCCCMETLM